MGDRAADLRARDRRLTLISRPCILIEQRQTQVAREDLELPVSAGAPNQWSISRASDFQDVPLERVGQQLVGTLQPVEHRVAVREQHARGA